MARERAARQCSYFGRIFAVAILAGSAIAGPDDDARVRYNRDVRPILSDRCFLCHGPDREARMADLRLDSFSDATRDLGDGKHAIMPGNLDASELWARISTHDPRDRMPPPESTKPALTAEELETIRAWIEGGAEYEAHWSFVEPDRPIVPRITDEGPGPDESWCRNEIDYFVLDRLTQAGLAPSKDAPPEILLRRVFLDLTGLPPTPDEIDAYLADQRPDRYERWVDRLLTEEPYATRYAEHMTAPWLDLARYADTSGIHMDNGRSIWPWRDWVLRAFHDNMPFDEFVIDQLGGDLIPDATLAEKVASGFNRNHVTTDEGGVIAEEYLVEYAVDRVNTTGSVFLGLTFGCARCHDHKFDPVTMEDYYGLFAFFNSNDEPGLYSQTQNPQRAYEPFIAVPSDEQQSKMEALRDSLALLAADRDAPNAEEDAQREAYLAGLAETSGVHWVVPGGGIEVESAESSTDSVLEIKDDGSVLASGPNPAKDVHTIRMRTEATDLRLVALEALTDESLPYGRVGRAPNGNVVISAIELEAVSIADPQERREVSFMWAWADVEQDNGDYHVENVLDPSPMRGWAVGAHFDGGEGPQGRVALLLADEAFGYEGGTELVFTLRYESVYAQHTFGRVRLSMASIDDAGLAHLPIAGAGFYKVGPFTTRDRDTVFDTPFGPESVKALDLSQRFDDKAWAFDLAIREGATRALSDGISVDYVAWEVYAPTAREVDLSLGSDDGIRLFVNGEEAFANRTERGVAPDQDSATVTLTPGRNTLVYKIVNTGGPSGIYTRSTEADAVPRPIVTALLPESAQTDFRMSGAVDAWRTKYSPRYREITEAIAMREQEIADLDAQIPRTMVMKELETPRETFVLTRGQYDHPDRDRPVSRTVPVSLGSLSESMPNDRLGLAEWIMSDDNPLTARVTINRFWAMLFGEGIVRTQEDFGMQGEWPTHPELLDWLAVEFRDSGWDIHHMLRLMVTSSTYRQDSRQSRDAVAIDPENRLLAYYPRQRLTAEEIRDQALYAAGLLVEKMGGPSVKPYQPEGLWREVAMIQSNTRLFELGKGEDLWRRSMYTYWKRAAPPPAMLTLDAPTREFCTVRRMSTNTPLQALVLWNDDQFVEAARAAASRVLREAEGDDARIDYAYRLCAARTPDADRREAMERALTYFRERYAEGGDDASSLVDIGMSMTPDDVDHGELAAWTMITSAIMASDAAITKR